MSNKKHHANKSNIGEKLEKSNCKNDTEIVFSWNIPHPHFKT